MLAECPHCHKHTISRWRDSWRFNGYAPMICPNCHTPVRVNQLLRYVLFVGPILLTYLVFGPVVSHAEPPPPSWVVVGGATGSYILGWVLSYWVPRYKEVKAKADTPPAHMDR